MRSNLPLAGFAVIEAANLEHTIDRVSRSPCAVAYGVVEVWPLQNGRAEPHRGASALDRVREGH